MIITVTIIIIIAIIIFDISAKNSSVILKDLSDQDSVVIVKGSVFVVVVVAPGPEPGVEGSTWPRWRFRWRRFRRGIRREKERERRECL